MCWERQRAILVVDHLLYRDIPGNTERAKLPLDILKVSRRTNWSKSRLQQCYSLGLH